MSDLKALLRERVLILDGGMGTMLQRMPALREEDAVKKVHKLYVEAGADIICTNTFTANEGKDIRYRNLEMTRAARSVADRAGRRVWVAGSVGPTNHTLVMATDTTFGALQAAYREQIAALAEGGVDLLIFETFFDTLNLKAALTAAAEVAPGLPVMVSVTLELSGRLLSGQTLEALVATVEPFHPLSIGLNCSFGAADMLPHVRELSRLASCYVSAYPNAGLPNQRGGYDGTPEDWAADMRDYLSEGLVNIVGGCCGTTPDHIRFLAAAAAGAAPRVPPEAGGDMCLAGLEPLRVNHFTQIGERCNVAGSRKFARLIADGNYDEALSVARRQVEGGAQVLDVCMDDALLDAKACMARFLHLMGEDPYVAKVPVMIDSSKWEVLEEGLRHVQGKAIVNSISLKEGEDVFLRRADYIRRMGAAVVVMAFDEQGQATTYERRRDVCARAYGLLTEKLGFPPEDIVFDPNVLAVATGLPEHDHYGADFIRTVEFIKTCLPKAKVSGGVSNLSFSFRGNNLVREAMHSVFLYHAVAKGMDMAIVNPEMLEVYDQIDPELRDKVEAVVLDTRPGAADDLIALADTLRGVKKEKASVEAAWRKEPVESRLRYAVINGLPDFLEADVNECLERYAPLDIVERVLMKGIEHVGEEFGEGKMFLPQVVKSAQVMKKAVSYLLPHLPKGEGMTRKKVVLATVKGDVHDIGKNIVGVVMACNGYEVIDLGVMVPKERIVEEAVKRKADAICLSGLITPSLAEMVDVARAMHDAGLEIPLMVGGATTSEKHTALYIAPEYEGPVAHTRDASQAVTVLGRLLADMNYRRCLSARYADMRRQPEPPRVPHGPVVIRWDEEPVHTPRRTGVWDAYADVVADIMPCTNWKMYAYAWGVRGDDAERLTEEATRFAAEHSGAFAARAAVGILPVRREGDTAVLDDGTRLDFVRDGASLADFLNPAGDYLGFFVATIDSESLVAECRSAGDEYGALRAQFLANTLVEGYSRYLHERMRSLWWGFPKGIRPAVGYPCLPEHRMKVDLFRILDATRRTGVTLTESAAMRPLSSVSGLYFACDRAVYL